MYITLTPEERFDLNARINAFEYLDEKNKEKTQMDVLNLMSSYIEELAYKYSLKSRVAKCDYVAEMQNTVLRKMHQLHLTKNNEKQIETYLYYWLNDTCQRLLADMNGPIAYSVYIHRKGYRGEEEIAVSTSLNNIVDKENETTFSDAVSTGEDMLEQKVAHESAKEFETILVNKFGKEAYEVFFKKHCQGKTCIRKKYEPEADAILEYIRQDKHLLELVQDFCK